MATLRREADSSLHALPSSCTVGRSPSCHLRTEEKFASWEHARISWTGTHWEIRDLGSRNGTFVDGRRLNATEPQVLTRGSKLGFGAPESAWEIQDVEAPGAVAVDLSNGQMRVAAGHVLALPSDEQPELSIYVAADGLWMVENTDGEVKPVQNHDVLQTQGRHYRLELPMIPEATPMADLAMTLDRVQVRFEVSADEERVETIVIHHGVEHRLQAREHAYVMLTMARVRQSESALPTTERGWRSVAEWAEMLRLSPSTINVAIHRARQQIGSLGMEDAAGIVEVGRGKRRFGIERVEIVRMVD